MPLGRSDLCELYQRTEKRRVIFAFKTGGERFAIFVGAPIEETSLNVIPITPTEESWNEADDRESICAATSRDGTELSETVEDNAASFPLSG